MEFTTEFTLEQVLQFVAVLGAFFGLRELRVGSTDRDLLESMAETPTSPVAAVTPRGYFEVVGEAWAEEPLRHPRVPEGLVFYRYIRREEYQILTDSGGTTRHEDLLEEEVEVVPFRVRDPSGQIPVDPRGARLEGRLLHRHVDGREGGLFRAPPGGLGGANAGWETKTASRMIHEIYGLTHGGKVYVLGSTLPGPGSGGARFGRGWFERRPFVISGRSEADLGERIRDQSSSHLLLGLAALLVTGACVLGCVYLPPEYLEFVFDLSEL